MLNATKAKEMTTKTVTDRENAIKATVVNFCNTKINEKIERACKKGDTYIRIPSFAHSDVAIQYLTENGYTVTERKACKGGLDLVIKW